MVLYEKEVRTAVKKGSLPKDMFKRFDNVFIALDATKDLGLFDIKKIKSSEERTYYCLRKGKFRAIFYLEKDYYHTDKSTLIKRSLFEFYENMVDWEIVKQFEEKEKKGKSAFYSAEEILKKI